MKEFPNCTDVCGFLEFNENTDLTENMLELSFKTMRVFRGGIRIGKSSLKSLSFFMDGLRFHGQTHGLHIRNNSQLIDISKLTKFTYEYTSMNFQECDIRIENNPQLDLERICNSGSFSNFLDIKTSGNLKNCGCRGGKMNQVENLENCKTLFGGLKISNFSDSLNLSKITEIRGDIEVKYTNYSNLSFLKNLKSIKVNNKGYNEKIVLQIQENPKMIKFGIPKLEKFSNIWKGYTIASFKNLHPDFCLTIAELKLFLEFEIVFMDLDAKICVYEDIKDVQYCKFKNLAKLGKNCIYLIGDLKIESGDERYVDKLKSLTHIFGRLIVENTELQDLGFLENLKYIASLEENLSIIQIVFNKKLKKVYFPAMKSLISKREFYAIIHNNHPDLVDPDSLDNYQLFDIQFLPKLNFYGGEFGCPQEKFQILGSDFFKTCTVITNGLQIRSSTEFSEISSFSNLKTVNGNILITNTTLENASFFENVEMFRAPGWSHLKGININIYNNSKLKKLGWDHLKELGYWHTQAVNLENLHPDFCISIKEMLAFLDSYAKFLHLHAKFCDFVESGNSPKICKFSNMSSLESDCSYIFGNLKIENGDEKFVEKLKNMSYIFGTLSILNTDLEDLKFLDQLQKMANLNESLPLIQIINNKNMKNVKFLNMHFSISKGFPRAIIEDNWIFTSQKSCMKFQYDARTNVTYNGANCRGQTNGASLHRFFLVVLIQIIFSNW